MGRDDRAAHALAAPGVAFEVERFGWSADDRLEVTGRWFGLRGHRFMRPVLTLHDGDDRRRMLALLEHKPWAADEGEEWVAAFPWQGERVEVAAAELAVAPSVAVDLPLPIGRKRRRGSARAQGPASRSARPQRAPARPEIAELRAELGRLQADRDHAIAAGEEERGALRERWAAEEQEVRRLRAELAAARERLADAEALARERDAAVAASERMATAPAE